MLAHIDSLMSDAPGTPESDELELWVHLVEEYEQARFLIPLPDPTQGIRFRMEQQGLKQKDLIPFIGSKSKVSEVLNGKRPEFRVHGFSVGLIALSKENTLKL